MSSKAPSTYPCKNCGRTFVKESLVKHEKVCKNITKPRKAFDSSKQRATEDLSVRQIKQAQKKAIPKPKTNWRQQHNEFINTIKAARGVNHALATGGPLPPPPPPAENPDYVECMYCGRRFNEKAAERHIKFCETQAKRLPGSKRTPKEDELARAEARKKYVPPKLKSKTNNDVMTSPGMTPTGGRSAGMRGGMGEPATRTPPGGAKQVPGRSPAAGGGYGSGKGPVSGVNGAPRAPAAGGYGSGRAPAAGGSSAGRTPAARGRTTGTTYQPGRYAR